jgi:DNA topoisomerase-1
MNVVVVESPAKAKTINKYLGPDYTVIASYGHVRDLPAKDGSVKPDQDFAMDWELDGRAAQRVAEIARAVKGAAKLFLATDPDREGEAISWHVLQTLQDKKLLKNVDVSRVVFNEVTKAAVLEAFAHPRQINQELVDAYLARRALDYLVGFTLSPVLWRKLPGSRSAGRVQSVALRLVCEREAEIEVFKKDEFWTVQTSFTTPSNAKFTARLTHLDGAKLDKLSLPNEAAAKRAVAAIAERDFKVASVERKQAKRNPYPPFTTSTLQQEASRKLGFGASRTMKVAQRLYEGVDIGGETVGLITYMRTDGVQLSNEAVFQARGVIEREYGPNYLPSSPRMYKTKQKNAQEAHEAVRPTDLSRRPEAVSRYLDKDQLRLYDLIWKRTLASQMASAVLDQVAVDIASPDNQVIQRANGSVILFDGFLKLYQEGRDDKDDDDESRLLPPMNEGDKLGRGEILPEQHFTQPPPRFTEASLVKQLEELGIGRPSTYASILEVLQERNYVRLEQRRFVPEDRGRLVTAFLSEFFERYVEYGFTADLEAQLDEVSDGRLDWRAVLRQFWGPFIAAVDDTKDLKISQVIDALDAALGQHFFPDDGSGKDPRLCPTCHKGRLGLRLGRNGGFIGCSTYPECRYTRPLAMEMEGEASTAAELAQPKELGADPATAQKITLRKGPYGVYVQLGDGDDKTKPKRASLPPGANAAQVTLEYAIGLLSLPREIGVHPESGEKIMAGIGKFGPYIKLGPTYKSLPRDEDVLTIGINRAVSLLAEVKPKAAPLRVLGPHPEDQGEISLFAGRYGPYLAYRNLRVTLPKGVDADALTLEQATALLATKLAAAKPPAKGKAAKGRKSAAKPKTATKATKTKAAAKPKLVAETEVEAAVAVAPRRRRSS